MYMNAEAIIFDKDGTLIDFDAFWVTVSAKAIGDILKDIGKEDIPVCEILSALGVHNGVTDINSVLCKGTYEQMGQIVYGILAAHGCPISQQETVMKIVDAYKKNSDAGEVKPTCSNLRKIITDLRKQGKRLAVVTTDTSEITHKCLKKLKIEEEFDKIYADDGKTPSKPDPYCIFDFCRLTGIEKDHIIMIGDTMTDIKFARNAGIRVIGVAKTPRNKEYLAPYADAVIPDISFLPSLLD